jgi:hypothetical protein
MSASLCVAVHGGPTTSPANVEQATCIGTSFAVQELWTLEAKPAADLRPRRVTGARQIEVSVRVAA